MSSESVYHPPRIEFVEVPDLARLADIVQPVNIDIRSISGDSAELWRGLAAALPTPTIPIESLVSPVAPALAPSVLNWREFTDVVDASLARPRRRRWWQR